MPINSVFEAMQSTFGNLYHFSSKDSLISGLQRRMVSRLEQTLQDAERQREPILQAFIRELRRDYESGGRRFAPLLLAREQQDPCRELQSLMACLVRRSGGRGGKKATLGSGFSGSQWARHCVVGASCGPLNRLRAPRVYKVAERFPLNRFESGAEEVEDHPERRESWDCDKHACDPGERSAGENAQEDEDRRHLDRLRLNARRQNIALQLLDRQEENSGEDSCGR
jgi:AcrR family transcriptional regulator